MNARHAFAALAVAFIASAAGANAEPLKVLPIVPPTLTPYVTPGETPQSDARKASAYSGQCDRQRPMSIEAADARLEPAGFVIDALGTAESAGWSNLSLMLVSQSPDGRTATLDLIGCRPEMAAAVQSPVEAHAILPLDRNLTRRVVIRTRTNAVTVDIER